MMLCSSDDDDDDDDDDADDDNCSFSSFSGPIKKLTGSSFVAANRSLATAFRLLSVRRFLFLPRMANHSRLWEQSRSACSPSVVLFNSVETFFYKNVASPRVGRLPECRYRHVNVSKKTSLIQTNVPSFSSYGIFWRVFCRAKRKIITVLHWNDQQVSYQI